MCGARCLPVPLLWLCWLCLAVLLPYPLSCTVCASPLCSLPATTHSASVEFVEERREQLDRYLQLLLNSHLSRKPAAIQQQHSHAGRVRCVAWRVFACCLQPSMPGGRPA
jgi:hypothetical protein